MLILFESTAIQLDMDQMLEASSKELATTFIQWYIIGLLCWSIQNMDAIVEVGRCIRGVVVFNGSLYSRVYGVCMATGVLVNL